MTRLSKQLFSGILNFVLNFSSVYLFSNDLLCTPGILLVDRFRQPSALIGRWGDRAASARVSTDIPVSKYLNISLSRLRAGWIAGPDTPLSHLSPTQARHHNQPRPLGSVFPCPHTGSDHITQITHNTREDNRGDSQDASTLP